MSSEPERMRQIYKSTNGDEWLLVRTADDIVVEHRPNDPSGGNVTRTKLNAFLAEKPYGPQHDELRRLVGTLVDAAEAGSSTS